MFAEHFSWQPQPVWQTGSHVFPAVSAVQLMTGVLMQTGGTSAPESGGEPPEPALAPAPPST